MTVYVDDMRTPYKGMLMSHMIADTLDELHEMADKIGVSREHFQDKPGLPHYDISQKKKALALKHGAANVPTRVLAMMAFNRRQTGHLGTPAMAEMVWRRLRAQKAIVRVVEGGA